MSTGTEGSRELVPLIQEVVRSPAEPTRECVSDLRSLFFLSEDIGPVFREFVVEKREHVGNKLQPVTECNSRKL